MNGRSPTIDDVASRYLYVLEEVERLRRHVTWLYTYYIHWGPYHFSTLYLLRSSWDFMRINIEYVTKTWERLDTLINCDDPPELRTLLNSLERLRTIWQLTKTFLEDVLKTSEYLYSMKLVV